MTDGEALRLLDYFALLAGIDPDAEVTERDIKNVFDSLRRARAKIEELNRHGSGCI